MDQLRGWNYLWFGHSRDTNFRPSSLKYKKKLAKNLPRISTWIELILPLLTQCTPLSGHFCHLVHSGSFTQILPKFFHPAKIGILRYCEDLKVGHLIIHGIWPLAPSASSSSHIWPPNSTNLANLANQLSLCDYGWECSQPSQEGALQQKCAESPKGQSAELAAGGDECHGTTIVVLVHWTLWTSADSKQQLFVPFPPFPFPSHCVLITKIPRRCAIPPP